MAQFANPTTGARGNSFTVSIEELVPFVDWTPFFHTWELRGVYPKIFQHEKHGEEARKLFADAQKLLEKVIAEKLLTPRVVYELLTWIFCRAKNAKKTEG